MYVPSNSQNLDDFPKELLHFEQVARRLNASAVLAPGGAWGVVRSGSIVVAHDGRRLVWAIEAPSVVFSRGDKVYLQGARGFLADMRFAPAVIGARNAAFMAQVAEAEMRLLMGVAAGASGLAFGTVVGCEVLTFVTENRHNFRTWVDQFSAVLKARRIMKTVAPVLYDKLFTAVLKQVWRDLESEFVNAVTSDVIAFGIGVIVGTAGKKMAAGRLSLLGVIFVVLEQLVIRSLSVVPQALGLAKDCHAAEIVAKLREAGVSLTEADVQRIMLEIQHHPNEVKEALNMLRSAFEGKALAR